MLTLRRKLTAYSVFCSQCGWLLFAKASWCEKHCGPSKGQKRTSRVMLWTCIATVHSYFWNWKWSGLEGAFSSAASSFCNFSSLLPNICRRFTWSTWSTSEDVKAELGAPAIPSYSQSFIDRGQATAALGRRAHKWTQYDSMDTFWFWFISWKKCDYA